MALTNPSALGALPGLTTDDLSWGWPFGRVPDLPSHSAQPADSDRRPPGGSARAWLESRFRELLTSRRVVITFSGGRDSSTVLALALHVARAEGLEEPVALTLRMPGHPDAHEDEWQDLVITHLGVSNWERVLVEGDEADVLGPYGREVLIAAGQPVFPFGSVVSGIEAERASGCYLVTGEFGDWVLGAQRLALVNAIVSRRGRAHPRVWSAALKELAPSMVRTLRSRDPAPAWLQPAQRRRWDRAGRDETRSAPLRWDTCLRDYSSHRAYRLGRVGLRASAAAYGADRVDPLGERPFLETLAGDAGRRGYLGRADVIRQLAGDLLPEALITRRTKATFNTSRFGPRTREWATGWCGEGVDIQAVDPSTLRDEWLSAVPSAASLGLLQQAWLATRADIPQMTDPPAGRSAFPGPAAPPHL